MGALDGKVVVFTGAGAGIGRATVARYVAEGAKVVGVDISPRVQELADEFPGSVIPIQADISTWDGNVSAVEVARNTWGRVDVSSVVKVWVCPRASSHVQNSSATACSRIRSSQMKSATAGGREK